MEIPASLKEALHFTYLPGYARFLIEHKVDQYVSDAIAMSREMDLPLLKYLNTIPEDLLIKQSKQSTLIFFEGFAENQIYEQLLENTKKWESNQLEIIEKDKLVAEDIKTATYIRKTLLLKYLREYTKDIDLIFKIVDELDQYIYYGELVAFNVYIHIQNEKINQHVSEIEKINHQLQQSTELSNQAEAITHIGNWIRNLRSGTVYWSNEMYRIYGMEPQQETITIELFNSMLHPADKEMVIAHLENAIKNKSVDEISYRILTRDSKVKFMHLKGKVVLDENGNAIEMIGTARDITLQKATDEALLKNQHFIQKIARISPSLVTVYNINTGKYSFVNQTLKQMLGYEPDMVLEKGVDFFISIMHPDDLSKVLGQNNEALAAANQSGIRKEEKIQEFIYRMKDVHGTYRWMHTYGTVFDRNEKGEVEEVINVSVDVTDQYELKEKFANEKAFADLLVESSPYMIMSYDTNYYVTAWNKKSEIATGLKKKDVLGYNIFELFPEYNNDEWLSQMNKVFEGEHIHFPKVKFLRQPGYGECFVVPLRDAKEEIIGVLSITNNITPYVETSLQLEEKNRELHIKNSELAKSGNFLQTLIDSSPDFIFVVDCDFKFILLNLNGAAFLKMPTPASSGLNAEDVFLKKFDQRMVQKINDCLQGEYDGKELISATNSDNTFLQTVLSPLKDENDKIYAVLIVSRDVTEMMHFTEDLRNAKLELEHINNELKKSEELYHKMVSEVEDYVIVLLDPDGRIENWNKGAEKIKGYKAAEIIGKHFSIFYTQEDRKMNLPEKTLHTAITRGKAEFEGWRVKKNGDLFWGSIVITPLYNEDAELLGFSKVSRDLTERKKAEDNLKKYTQQLEIKNQELQDANISLQNARQQLADDRTRLLINAIPLIVAMTSREGKLEFTNQLFNDFTGSNPEELTGHGWMEFIHKEDIEQFKESIEDSIFNMDTFEGDFRLRRADGKYIWHHAILKPFLFEEYETATWVITINNIHDQKLIDANKDEFIGIASHELKTPLTSIKAYIQLLKENIEQNKLTDILYLANKANHNINRLNDLISELLDLTRIQHRKLSLHFTEFNFSDAVDEVIDMLRPSTRHIIRKRSSEECKVTADRDRIQQVIINLISNAIKYSPNANEVDIDINTSSDEISFSVQDYGIGIPKSDLEKIFTRFYRVEANSAQFQGLGIGLFITAEIIKRHNGKIWVHSTPGKGSVFYFKIPIKSYSCNEKISVTL